jgi:hypothetical protein
VTESALGTGEMIGENLRKQHKHWRILDEDGKYIGND